MAGVNGLVPAEGEVSRRQMRKAIIDCLQTLDQHTGVINGQIEKLSGLGRFVADLSVRQDELDARLSKLEAAQRQADGMEAA